MQGERRTAGWILLAGLLMAGAPLCAQPAPGLVGTVRAPESQPIASAHVFAFSLASSDLRKVATDLVGRFQFDQLPAGIYQVVAYKSGFVPAVVGLTRSTPDQRQILDIDLVPEVRDASLEEDYWDLRARIPSDVLREIATLAVLEASVAGGVRLPVDEVRFEADLVAEAGSDDIVAPDAAQLAGGRIDLRGQVASMKVGFSGDFRQLESTPDAAGAQSFKGSAQSMSLDLRPEDRLSRLQISSARNRQVTLQDGVERPVDFEHLSLLWDTPVGDNAESSFAARLIDETNYYQSGLIDPLDVPNASRTWEVEGSYSRELGERSVIEAGIRYREREATWGTPGEAPRTGAERAELFGQGGYRLRPSMLIEYGVYSVLRDGEIALAPQGGLVLQLNPQWQLSARASGRFEASGASTDWPGLDFLPVFLDGSLAECDRAEERCYRLALSRSEGDDLLSLGAVHRELGETFRVYLSRDFFDRSESIYLVPGDRLNELNLSVARRLSPNILTRVASSVAAGGGGTFLATVDDGYENQVRYLIASIDTQFQATSTGVFLAFHQVEQNFSPLDDALAALPAQLSERLQLTVTQDLNVLLDLPADWALQLNMELARQGESGGPNEIRRRVLGGLAIRF